MIRRLAAEQLEVVVGQVTPLVQKRRKIGVTTSQHALTDSGSLDRLPPGHIEWKRMMAEERHPLLDPQTDGD